MIDSHLATEANLSTSVTKRLSGKLRTPRFAERKVDSAFYTSPVLRLDSRSMERRAIAEARQTSGFPSQTWHQGALAPVAQPFAIVRDLSMPVLPPLEAHVEGPEKGSVRRKHPPSPNPGLLNFHENE